MEKIIDIDFTKQFKNTQRNQREEKSIQLICERIKTRIMQTDLIKNLNFALNEKEEGAHAYNHLFFLHALKSTCPQSFFLSDCVEEVLFDLYRENAETPDSLKRLIKGANNNRPKQHPSPCSIF